VVNGGGADLMLQFWLERRDDGMKHYQKMKQRQRAHLASMGWKRNTVRRCDDVSRKRGGTRDRVKRDETTSVGLT
jgi:hypothetical protein